MDYTHDEITAEYNRLGMKYPKITDFTEDQITCMMEQQSFAGDQGVSVATLNGKDHPADVVVAFAKLATALGGNFQIAIGYEALIIVRPSNDAERRNRAVSTLQSERYQQDRADALNHLRDDSLGSVRDYA